MVQTTTNHDFGFSCGTLKFLLKFKDQDKMSASTLGKWIPVWLALPMGTRSWKDIWGKRVNTFLINSLLFSWLSQYLVHWFYYSESSTQCVLTDNCTSSYENIYSSFWQL